jgi:hypothetical protein
MFLSSAVYTKCKKVLLECPEFETLEALKLVFIVSELHEYRANLPEVRTKAERVAATIDYLVPQYNLGQSVFVIFLQQLASGQPEGANLKMELSGLIDLVQNLDGSLEHNKFTATAPPKVSLNTNMPEIRVFISSSGKDLADYREATIEICSQLGLRPVAMELFEGRGASAIESSKRELAQANLYVGIFAHRYGYIEQGYTKAASELEFDYAQALQLEQLCFLVDPSYPWPPDLIDYEHYQQLTLFKEKIARFIRAEFTSIDDFKAKLIYSIVEWQKKQHLFTGATPVFESSFRVIPFRPNLVIGREEAINELKERFGINSSKSRRSPIIIRGWPGVGKTTLVNNLVYDTTIKQAFRDDVLWCALGQSANVFGQLTSWGRQLGILGIEHATSLQQVIEHLRAALQSKQLLLIVDDIWKSEDGIPFKQIVGSESVLVFTTRFGDVARSLANLPDDIYVLGVLSDENATALLRKLTPEVVKKYPEKTLELVKDLEGLPLAIRVAGRLLDSRTSLGVDVLPLIEEIRKSRKLLDEKAPDDRFDPVSGTTPTINLLFKISTDLLDTSARECFIMVGVFAPKPATFSFDALQAVWEVADPLPIVQELVDRGLLEFIPSQARFQMHAMLAKHAEALLED